MSTRCHIETLGICKHYFGVPMWSQRGVFDTPEFRKCRPECRSFGQKVTSARDRNSLKCLIVNDLSVRSSESPIFWGGINLGRIYIYLVFRHQHSTYTPLLHILSPSLSDPLEKQHTTELRALNYNAGKDLAECRSCFRSELLKEIGTFIRRSELHRPPATPRHALFPQGLPR